MIESTERNTVAGYEWGDLRPRYAPEYVELRGIRTSVKNALLHAPSVWEKVRPILEDPNRYGRIFGYEGVFRTPSGLIGIHAWIDNRPGQEEEIWLFETMIDGRSYSLRQERTGRDRLTEVGAKRVAHRWLRKLRSELGY